MAPKLRHPRHTKLRQRCLEERGVCLIVRATWQKMHNSPGVNWAASRQEVRNQMPLKWHWAAAAREVGFCNCYIDQASLEMVRHFLAEILQSALSTSWGTKMGELEAAKPETKSGIRSGCIGLSSDLDSASLAASSQSLSRLSRRSNAFQGFVKFRNL